MSRRARARANARPWASGEFVEHDDDIETDDLDAEPDRCPNTLDLFDDQRTSTCQHASTALK